jgi:hypothetical protein
MTTKNHHHLGDLPEIDLLLGYFNVGVDSLFGQQPINPTRDVYV